MSQNHTNVAIVDDDESVRRGLKRLLQVHQCIVQTYASAEEFLARGDTTRVDCLLLDIDLGGMSGIELRRQLKSSGSALPIIFMTALDDEALRAEALEAGCIAFLRKPFPARQLMDAIAKAQS